MELGFILKRKGFRFSAELRVSPVEKRISIRFS